MIKRFIAIILAMLMLMAMTACDKEETTNPPKKDDEQISDNDSTMDESIPGVVELDEPITNPLEDDGNSNGDNNNNTNSPSNNDNDEDNNETNNGNNSNNNNNSTNGGNTVENVPTVDECSYEEYINMTPDEQYAFYQTFESMREFVEWYYDAKDEYQAEHPDIVLEDDTIDLGELFG